MEKVHPLELLEYMAFHVSPLFNSIRVNECVFNQKEDMLTVNIIYDERAEDKVGSLKNNFETEFIKCVKGHIDEKFKIEFAYEKSYIDEILLKLHLVKFLKTSFVLTIDLADDDVSVLKADDGYLVTLTLSKQNAKYIENGKVLDKFLDECRRKYFDEFNYRVIEKECSGLMDEVSFIDKYIAENEVQDAMRVDKVMKISGLEYYLGKPIKERPIKIEFLRVTQDDQIIAGTISNFTRREFTAKLQEGQEGEPEKKPFFTFMLDDGKSKASCVHFPNIKTLAKFEKLVDGTTICVIGQNTERNGRVGFRVSGVSFCEIRQS
ncbi:MAG: hypothetical protein FWE45_02265 [Firmicutes bacterium]|nr:hypothetical protein [Bacillota bacterium]